MYNIIYLITLTLFSSLAYASQSETIKVVSVLKGDTFIGTNYKGQMKIYHLQGVDCAELNSPDGPAAKDFLSGLINNKKIYVTTKVVDESHALARVFTEFGGGGKNVGAEMLRNGLCWFRDVESDGLSSVDKASFKLLADQARHKKKGIWKNGDVYFSQNPDSWRSLNLERYTQPYIGGTYQPNVNSFDRPQVKEPASEKKDKGPVDWRTPVGKR